MGWTMYPLTGLDGHRKVSMADNLLPLWLLV